jgi:diacylglycerol kinase family enzyme
MAESLMRCALIYNPAAGRNRHRRCEQLRLIKDNLSARGHAVNLVATTGPRSATAQASEAAAEGADIVFACGGDGTVHEVLQGLVSEQGNPRVCLGILPIGSANALARHLRLSLDPLTAAMQQIEGEPLGVPVGKLVHNNEHRYFAVMAGAGPDGALAYEVLAAHKSNLGRFAYYMHAARLFMTRRFRPYDIRYCEAGSGKVQMKKAVSIMAVRIGDMGGLFRGLTSRSASIHDSHLRLLVLAPPAAISLPLWFLSGWLNLHGLNPYLKFIDVSEVSSHTDKTDLHIQADGEWLGHGAMSLSLIPNALLLRVPSASFRPRAVIG